MCNGNKVKRRGPRYRDCEMRGTGLSVAHLSRDGFLVTCGEFEERAKKDVKYVIGWVQYFLLFPSILYPRSTSYVVTVVLVSGHPARCSLESRVLRSELMMSCGDAFGSDCEWPEDHSGTGVSWERVGVVRLLHYRYDHHKVCRFQPRLIDE